jgi:pimeloyl-ACP methyl ester carboxylesterase
LLDSVFAAAGDGPLLVGHSYGAAVALKAALMHPRRVRALALYEPTLFGLLDAESPPPNAADGIRQAVADAEASLAQGDATAAAGIFIDYWMGAGAWAATPDARRGAIVAAIADVGGWGRALFGEPATLADWARIDVPVLLMTGSDSPASARGVARLLAQALPRVQVVAFDGLGHMGPVTHPDTVNDVVTRFLHTCQGPAT